MFTDLLYSSDFCIEKHIDGLYAYIGSIIILPLECSFKTIFLAGQMNNTRQSHEQISKGIDAQWMEAVSLDTQTRNKHRALAVPKNMEINHRQHTTLKYVTNVKTVSRVKLLNFQMNLPL